LICARNVWSHDYIRKQEVKARRKGYEQRPARLAGAGAVMTFINLMAKRTRIWRLQSRKYRSTPHGKATTKASNAKSHGRKNEWRRRAREDPVYVERRLEQARGWILNGTS
jgi:hypothetical protein